MQILDENSEYLRFSQKEMIVFLVIAARTMLICFACHYQLAIKSLLDLYSLGEICGSSLRTLGETPGREELSIRRTADSVLLEVFRIAR